MIIPLDRRGSKPVFRQIVDYLRRAIEAGRLEPGTKLAPIRVLSRQLGVNRETVADAYRELEALGLTESGVGRGTFVLARTTNGAAPAEPEPAERPFVPMLSRIAEAAVALRSVDFSADARAIRCERGTPDASLFPVDDFRKALNDVLRRGGRALLEYGDPRGHLDLRRVLVERLTGVGIQTDADGILVTGGSTQGIAIAARIFCEPGDTVAIESPIYQGVAATFTTAGLRIAPLPMTEGGLDLDALESLLARKGARLVYTVPSFHNPTGISTSLEHRRRLLQLTARHGVPVIEDDFEKDLRIRGRATPPLKALDRTGHVVYVGTFSKALFPGARVGWLVAGPRVIEAAIATKRALDLVTTPVVQAALAHLCREGAYDRHLRRVARELDRRFARAMTALEEHMPEGSHFVRPDGGLAGWVTLPESIDTLALLPAAKQAGVVYAPGQLFYPDDRRSSALRLSVAQATVEDLERGIRVLGEAVRAALPRRRAQKAVNESPGIHV